MTLEDVISFYGTSYQFAKETGFSASCYYNWRKFGFIPIASQHVLADLSGGKLKVDATKGGVKYDSSDRSK